MFTFFGNASSDTTVSLLKPVFELSRLEKNIDLVLPVFLKSRLYIVTGGEPDTKDYFLVPSPNKERLCVTVSEDIDNLKNIAWPKVAVTGELLIRVLPPGIEIVVVYKDGGDYITREHLQWYRSIIK